MRATDQTTDHTADPETPVTTWEYATAPLVSHALQQILNQWGSQGWELVCVVDNVAYFKRPVASEEG